MSKKEPKEPTQVPHDIDMQLWQYGQGCADTINAHIKMINKPQFTEAGLLMNTMDWPAILTAMDLMINRLIKARRDHIRLIYHRETTFTLVPKWNEGMKMFEMQKKYWYSELLHDRHIGNISHLRADHLDAPRTFRQLFPNVVHLEESRLFISIQHIRGGNLFLLPDANHLPLQPFNKSPFYHHRFINVAFNRGKPLRGIRTISLPIHGHYDHWSVCMRGIWIWVELGILHILRSKRGHSRFPEVAKSAAFSDIRWTGLRIRFISLFHLHQKVTYMEDYLIGSAAMLLFCICNSRIFTIHWCGNEGAETPNAIKCPNAQIYGSIRNQFAQVGSLPGWSAIHRM